MNGKEIVDYIQHCVDSSEESWDLWVYPSIQRDEAQALLSYINSIIEQRDRAMRALNWYAKKAPEGWDDTAFKALDDIEALEAHQEVGGEGR